MSSPDTVETSPLGSQPKLHTQSAKAVPFGPPGRDGQLCAQCSSLGLVIDKFLPPEAAESSLPGFLDGGFDSAGLDRLDFGYLDVIYRRRLRCPFCRLIFEATRTSGGSGIGLDGLTSDGSRVLCSLDWQLDGRRVEDGSKPPTRRLRVFHSEEAFPDAYIVPLPATRASTAEPTFLGRRIAEGRVDLGLIRGWLDMCQRSHGSECDQGTLTDMPVAPLTAIRFIDVEDGRLVAYDSLGREAIRYATVSYVWGRAQFLKLLRSNYHELLERLDPDMEGVPNTLRDAMILTKHLGIRYLWIDSLCIMQDDAADWQSTAPQMDRIYGNSALNICAALGTDPSDGLPGTSHTLRTAIQSIARYGSLDLTIVRPVESLIEKSMWNKRAWTFQERMLSRRSLIFTQDRIFFQCRGSTWSEEMDSESNHKTWTLEMVRSPIQNFSKNPVRLFFDCVELHSGRKLTVPTDRLIAFNGMEAVLLPPLRASPFYGLPDSYFDFALLWECKTPSPRMKTWYPSWSWCGWEGACTWRMSMVSGTLLNLNEWLAKHTWVVWYKVSGGDDHDGSSEAQRFSYSDRRPRVFRTVWTRSHAWPRQELQKVSRWDGYQLNTAPYGRETPYRGILTGSEERPTEPTQMLSREPFAFGMLYFWTWTAHFQLSRKSMTTAAFASKLEPGLHRFGILDAKGDWCGTVVLDNAWFDLVGGVFEFAAISEAREFSMEELDTWNYYIPEERAVSEWYLFYAILLKWDDEGTVAERMGLAKIYQDAYRSASFPPGVSWKEIRLV